MILSYQSAVVGLCDDLTNPNASTTPLAVIVIGQCGGSHIGAVAYRETAGLDWDPMTRDVLGDVPDLLQRHLDTAFKTNPRASLGAILRELYHSLRNSLHVVRIDEEQSVEVEGISMVPEKTVQVLSGLIAGIEREKGHTPPTRPSVPTHRVWPLHQPQHAVSAH